MKNFKFRAWKKVNTQEMLNDVRAIDFDKRMIKIGYPLSRDTTRIDTESLDNVKLMQSTGLKDDFGNELFEGDIFESRFSEIKYVVYWDDKLASFWIKGESKEHPLYALTPFHPRILGNIYENPELLEDN